MHEPSAHSADTTLQKWADKFLDESGYLLELRRQEKDAEAGDARVRNLRELTATLDGNNVAGKALFERLETFLEDITLDSDREDEEEKGDVVTLITMHSCKGLEFPRVFIVGLEDGLLPHTRSTARGHAGRGAPAVLRGRHPRDVDPDHQPLCEPDKIRAVNALPSVPFSEGAAPGTRGTCGGER